MLSEKGVLWELFFCYNWFGDAMKAYHFTSVNNLESISKKGLVPGNGDNSKLIDDQKEKVFFSEGFEGVIALYVDFNLVFENIKLGKSDINDLLLKDRVDGCNS